MSTQNSDGLTRIPSTINATPRVMGIRMEIIGVTASIWGVVMFLIPRLFEVNGTTSLLVAITGFLATTAVFLKKTKRLPDGFIISKIYKAGFLPTESRALQNPNKNVWYK